MRYTALIYHKQDGIPDLTSNLYIINENEIDGIPTRGTYESVKMKQLF